MQAQVVRLYGMEERGRSSTEGTGGVAMAETDEAANVELQDGECKLLRMLVTSVGCLVLWKLLLLVVSAQFVAGVNAYPFRRIICGCSAAVLDCTNFSGGLSCPTPWGVPCYKLSSRGVGLGVRTSASEAYERVAHVSFCMGSQHTDDLHGSKAVLRHVCGANLDAHILKDVTENMANSMLGPDV